MAGKMNLSVQDSRGGLLVVSQFTLYARCAGASAPSFDAAARAEEGKRLYQYFIEKIRDAGLCRETGSSRR